MEDVAVGVVHGFLEEASFFPIEVIGTAFGPHGDDENPQAVTLDFG
jgi:hypothetical protein